MRRVLGPFLVATGMLGSAMTANAQPMEFVRVCDAYGTGYYYVPGTETCFNPMTGDAREPREGGTMSWYAPSNPGTWVANAAAGCAGGRLVELPTVNAASLAYNAPLSVYETAPYSLALGPGEFIANVMMRGSVDAGDSNFCLSFRDATPVDPDLGTAPQYSVLGCRDTGPLHDQDATWSFTPLRSVAPSEFVAPVVLVGNTIRSWSEAEVGDRQLDIALCIRGVDDTGACSPESATCGEDTPDVCIGGGTIFTVAVTGPSGTVYAVCSIAPAGFEGATRDEFRCVGAAPGGTPTLFTAEQVATNFGDGFCGDSGAME